METVRAAVWVIEVVRSIGLREAFAYQTKLPCVISSADFQIKHTL